MILTRAFILAGRSSEGTYSARQLELLGRMLKLTKGWTRALVGKQMDDQDAQEFAEIGRSRQREPRQYVYGRLMPDSEAERILADPEALERLRREMQSKR